MAKEVPVVVVILVVVVVVVVVGVLFQNKHVCLFIDLPPTAVPQFTESQAIGNCHADE